MDGVQIIRIKGLALRIRNHNFKVDPVYHLGEVDAGLLLEALQDWEVFKQADQREKERQHRNYLKNREKKLAYAKERYQKNKAKLFEGVKK